MEGRVAYGQLTYVIKTLRYVFMSNFKQVRPNDVWTCVACSYFIYKKLT